MMKEKIGAIIVGAGSGNRMHGVDKIFTNVLNRPVLAYSLDVMANFRKIDDLVLVLAKDNLKYGKKLLDSELKWPSDWKIKEGGPRRRDSVLIGIQALGNVDWVIIHDAARPCLTVDLLDNVIEAAKEVGAAITVGSAIDTVKKIDSMNGVTETLDREFLVLAQTPQVFRMDLLRSAYRKINDDEVFTDEATLFEIFLNKVKVVRNIKLNPKITYPEDLWLVESIIKNRIQGKN
jgi:2-C-methyl-D-erythritol 4-phosphate cytidylyltransferase